jgi:hypothetical protein
MTDKCRPLLDGAIHLAECISVDTDTRGRGGFRLDDDRWRRRLDEVVDFVSENDRLPVQTSTAPVAERRMSYWLSNQRAEHKSCVLTESRVEELNRLLPGWTSTAAWQSSRTSQLTA